MKSVRKREKMKKIEKTLKKVDKTFGGFEINHYLCTRFKELSNTLRKATGRLAQLV